MALREDLGKVAGERREELRLEKERRQRFEDEWERIREDVIRPVCDDVVSLAKDSGFWTAGFARENGSSVLLLGASTGYKGVAQLRFIPKPEQSKIECALSAGQKNTTEAYGVEQFNRAVVETAVRHVVTSFMALLENS